MGIAPIRVWVIKQVDADILHLCGIGTLYHPRQRPWAALHALREGRYQGGVRLGTTGIVLNSRLFAALPPQDDLRLEGGMRANWQGQEWRVAQVPQRSWQHEGRLVAQRVLLQGEERLISSEDVSGIRANVDPNAPLPGTVVFQPGISRGGDTILSAYRAREQRRRRDS
ncbi:hypothetical protein [Halomonas sp. BM-2019]|uniref:hypothetical protein n=1 Tax=Halomonas sp. BM-2019 TaxID=2811227 RepID=UPI001B3C489D|nr:MAG: hypothetical protein J5F18_11635 [Halomonas sp. BM-2019]